MQLGVTLFGGSPFGRVSGAGSVATGTAQASAWAEVIRLGAGTCVTSATAAMASATRTQVVTATILLCTAVAAGAASVVFTANPLPFTGSATVSGTTLSLLNAYGNATGTATGYASGFRRTKAKCVPANCTATLEGQGYIFELAQPSVARATAIGYGTTNVLGYGHGTAHAYLSVTPLIIRGGAGLAIAVATGAPADSIHQKGGAGPVNAIATLMGDAVVIRGGIEYHDANGEGVCSATADVLYSVVYQPQFCYGVATGSLAIPHHQKGGKGRATAVATWTADPLVYGTGATADVAGARTTCVGNVKLTAGGKGTAVAVATLSNTSALITNTKAVANPVVATATVTSTAAVRKRLVSGTAIGRTTTSATPSKDTKARTAPMQGTAALTVTTCSVAVGAAPAIAEAVVYGRADKIVNGEGVPALAAASAFGYMWVNNAGPGDGFNEASLARAAPDERTVFVKRHLREVVVPAQIRLIAA